MIDPYNRSDVIKLLRRAADHLSAGVKSADLSATTHQLADHLEQED